MAIRKGKTRSQKESKVTIKDWAVVVIVGAQLAEQLLPTPEICSSNPATGKFYLLSTVWKLYCKAEYKENEAENGPF